MIRVRRRGTTRSLPLVVLAMAVVSTVVMPLSAHAGTIQQTEAEIKLLSGRLARLSKTSEISANAYDAAKTQLATLNANIYSLKAKEATKRADITLTAKALVNAVVRAYVLGAADAQVLALFNQSATQSDARKVFEEQVVGNLDQLKSTYENQRTSLENTIAQVAVQRRQANDQTYAMSALLAENLHNIAITHATLSSLTCTSWVCVTSWWPAVCRTHPS